MDPLVVIFAECLGVPAESITEETSPENEPKWDSLASMELVTAIEEQFNASLSTREIMSMRSVGIARSVLEKKGVL